MAFLHRVIWAGRDLKKYLVQIYQQFLYSSHYLLAARSNQPQNKLLIREKSTIQMISLVQRFSRITQAAVIVLPVLQLTERSSATKLQVLQYFLAFQ